MTQRPRWVIPAHEVVLCTAQELREKVKAQNNALRTVYSSKTTVEAIIRASLTGIPFATVLCMYEDFVISCKFMKYDLKDKMFISASSKKNYPNKFTILSLQMSIMEECNTVSPIHVDQDLLQHSPDLSVMLSGYSFPNSRRLLQGQYKAKLNEVTIEPNGRIYSFYMAKLNAAYESWTTAKEFDEQTASVTPETFLP